MRRNFWVIGILVLAVLLGFVEERSKISLNFTTECASKIEGWDVLTPELRKEALYSCREFRPSDYYSNHEDVVFYQTMELSGLKMLKWLLAVIWIFVFWIVNGWLLKTFFRGNFPLMFLHGTFILLGAGVVFFFAFGKWTASFGQSYCVARELLGALQSVVPCFILGFGHYLFNWSVQAPD